jgi:serine/threonine-protein kinase
MSASLIGKKLGNYRISARIGGGGVGQVWRAEDTTLGRTVAIKALRPELAGRSQIADRFRAEAQTLASLNHPNVATLFALLEHAGELWMVLEYVEGQTFAALLRQAGPLALEPCFELLHQVFDGIGCAHESGVIHRDIKPSNLMVDGRGLVKVMDFGIARTSGSERMTRQGGLVGTPEYMSPEQIRGLDATIRSDVYALGILLYEMLTGRPPFRRDGEFDVMRAQVEQLPDPPRTLRPDLSVALEEVILQSLAKAPEARYEDVERFRSALIAVGAPERTGSSLPTLLAEAATVDRRGPDTAPAFSTVPAAIAPSGRRAALGRRAAAICGALAIGLAANALHVDRSSQEVTAAPTDRAMTTASAPSMPPTLPADLFAPGIGSGFVGPPAPAARPALQKREAPVARPPKASVTAKARRATPRRSTPPSSQPEADAPAPSAPEHGARPEETGWVIRR